MATDMTPRTLRGIRTVRLWCVYCPASKVILYHSATRKRLHKNVDGCLLLKLTGTYAAARKKERK